MIEKVLFVDDEPNVLESIRRHIGGKLTMETATSGADGLRLAAMLSQIGCIALPPEVLTKVYSGASLDGEEQRLYETHPDLAAKLLGSIPRLEEVARIIAAQMTRPDLTGAPQIAGRWDSKPLGGLVLDEDLKSRNGIRLVPQGHEVTNTIMVRLRSIAAGVGIKEPFRVRVQT